jgi:hypothetical protein
VTRVVLVPGVLALLPEYTGLTDPVAEVRAACLDAVAWLGDDVAILADPQGERVARALLEAVGPSESGAESLPRPPAAILVVGNGSACRSEKAPGHLDERASGFDDALRAALAGGDVSGLDVALGAELLASLDGIARLGEVLTPGSVATVDYDDDPFGVQYWVMRWES